MGPSPDLGPAQGSPESPSVASQPDSNIALSSHVMSPEDQTRAPNPNLVWPNTDKKEHNKKCNSNTSQLY